ncbi:hypothetical protein LMH87_001854 [Akanthomyces muscarius]|uniref:Zn(2)-C6 fungal-type domain-containing protein n=1 Tax=Akanthomyces muscarius TaxID=2231603 RepID=A0A9W8UIN0_AKAMU|nr:hypothetical protein LMH87_001854 [Akanthomyces muscarius]KAJ4147322.1 hypothetical protein LMH87_001854 [Akanthomyces muscarius]
MQRSTMTTDNNAPPPKSGIKRTSYKSATYRGDGIAVTSDINGRRRARKACENCRSKKTKCDGEFPCNRCKDRGLICTVGTKKRREYKKMPGVYAEVLEGNQLTMAAAIQRPYRMIRRSEPWELDEPGLNDNGQPIVHNIAQMLRCIHPGSVQLLSHPVLAEDEPTVAELARWLEERQLHELEISEWLGPGATCSDSAASGFSSDNYAKCGASLDLGGLRASSPKDYTTAPRGHDTILSDAESLANVTDATLRDTFTLMERAETSNLGSTGHY